MITISKLLVSFDFNYHIITHQTCILRNESDMSGDFDYLIGFRFLRCNFCVSIKANDCKINYRKSI